MRNIRLWLAYDGTNFQGWQVQRTGRTVQGTVEKALARIHGQHSMLWGAGRTDSGVHADGQVANFRSNHRSIEGPRFREALNSLLPHDVRVLKSRAVDESFNARFDARVRVYHYRLLPAPIIPPCWCNYCHRVGRRLDIAHLNRMAACLLGERDFTTFATASSENINRVRRIHSAVFYPAGPFVIFSIAANGFLRRMVRSIVGTMLGLLREQTYSTAPQRLAAALAASDRRLAGPTAPLRDSGCTGCGTMRQNMTDGLSNYHASRHNRFAQNIVEMLDDLAVVLNGGYSRPSTMSAPPHADAPPAAPSAPKPEHTELNRREALEQLAITVEKCRLCPLGQQRTQAVCGVGVLDPLVMIIGEAPGAEEDARGEPFVGRAGKYLDKWLAAIDLSRERNVYITNVIKCRPPANRDPRPDEMFACRPYLRRQIELVVPRTILILGRIAADEFTGGTSTLGGARGRTYYFQKIPVIVTYHPSAVLRNSRWREPVWEDLKRLRTLLQKP